MSLDSDRRYKSAMELHDACARNQVDVVKELLSRDTGREVINSQPLEIVEYCRIQRSAPIHVAAQNGNISIVECLAQFPRCNLDIVNHAGDTPLCAACEHGHLHVVQYLLKKECNVNHQNKVGTPLFIALSHGHLDIAEVLLTTARCDVNCGRDSYPLHLACTRGRLDVVEFLLSNPNCDIKVKDSDCNTPLHIACAEGHLEIARCLLKKECGVNHRNKVGNTPLCTALSHDHVDIAKALLAEARCDVNRGRGSRPLHLACTHGHLDIVELLLSNPNCDINIKDSDHNTPLHIACAKGHLSVVHCLVEKECDFNRKNRHGKTPLHIACAEGYFDIVEFLFSVGDMINIKDLDGNTPLHVACKEGYLSIVKLLLSNPNCDMNIKNWDGNTPLHVTCYIGYRNVMKLLLNNPNSDVNIKNSDGNTPLHITCKEGYLDTVKLLLSNPNCDTNIQDWGGSTALHIACSYPYFNTVKLLLGNPNCDMNIEDSDGNTPLHVACRGDNLRIVRALLATGKSDPTVRNHHGRVPIEMTFGYTITREVSLYAKATLKLEKKNPLGSYVQVFVAGYASTGKTTLIEVLCREAAALLKLVPKTLSSSVRTFRDAKPHTPGIVPHKLNSKAFGTVVIHDLAGQYEYYSSHAAVVENSVLTSAPLFVIVVDLSEKNASIRKRLSYWLSFVKNHCKKATTPPHVTVVGSHKDVVKAKGEDVREKLSLIREALPTESQLHFTDPPAIALDCRDVASRRLSKLRSIIKRSCLALREGQSVYFGCHALYGFLHNFQELAFTVRDILSQIEREDILLPQTVPGLLELLSALHDKGLVLLLKNTSDPASSWVIFRKDELLSTVNGKLFAPEYKSTGVVSLSALTKEFPDYDPHVVVGLLSHLEFCKVIDGYAKSAMDIQMSSEHTFNSEEEFYLFPGLIKTERPQEHIWQVDNESDYCCGWTLRCTETEEFLETRFLHVLLLRLAFSFPLIPEEAPPTQGSIPAITRRCMMWRNGIRWLTGSGGIETLVEVLDDNRMLVLMMSCREEEMDGCAKLRSEVINEILKAKHEVCESISTKKSLIHRSQLSFPLDSHKLSLFNIEELIERVHKRTTTDAVDTDGVQKIPIERLLGFEPYISISQNIVRQVLSERDAHTCVPRKLLTELDENCSKYLHFHEHFEEYKGRQDLTFQTLRCEVFNKFSIFDAQFHKVIISYISYGLLSNKQNFLVLRVIPFVICIMLPIRINQACGVQCT